MSNESQIGIALEFRSNTDALTRLTESIQGLNTSVQSLTQIFQSNVASVQQMAQAHQKLAATDAEAAETMGREWKKAFDVLVAAGVTSSDALAQITVAFENGGKASQTYSTIQEELWQKTIANIPQAASAVTELGSAWERVFNRIVKGGQEAAVALQSIQEMQAKGMSAPDALASVKETGWQARIEQIKAEQAALVSDSVATAENTEKKILLNGVMVDLNKSLADQISVRHSVNQTTQQNNVATSEETKAAIERGRAIEQNTAAMNANAAAHQAAIARTRELVDVTGTVVPQYTRLNENQREALSLMIANGASVEQINKDFKEVGVSTGSVSVAMKEMGVSVDGATAKGTAGIHNMWQQSFLFFGVAMMVNSAVQQLALTTGEKANPALMQFGRIMQEVSSGAMIGMMSGAGAAGMGIGALVGLLLGAVTATGTMNEKVMELNRELTSLAKKDDAIEALSEQARVSKEVAEAAMSYAKENKEAANQLQENIKAVQTSTVVLQGMGDALEIVGNFAKIATDQLGKLTVGGANVADTFQKVGDALRNAEVRGRAYIEGLASGKDPAKAWDDATWSMYQAAHAQEILNDNTVDYASKAKVATDAAKEYLEVLKNIENLAKETINAQYAFSAAVQQTGMQAANSERDYAQSSEKLLRDYNLQATDSAFQRTQQSEQSAHDRAKIDQQLADRLGQIEQQSADRIADINLNLRDKEFDAIQNYNDKLDDLAYSHAQKEISYAKDIVDTELRLRDELYKISRSQNDDQEDQSYRKAQDLAKAKTYAEYQEVLARDEHERHLIDRRTGEQTFDAQKQKTDAETEIYYRMKLTDDEYQHSKQVADRELNEQIARAQREAAEQIAQAQRTAREQEAAARQQNKEEIADFNFKVAQQEASAIHQAAQAKQRYLNQQADAKQRWQNEESDISKRFQLEWGNIELSSRKYADYAQGVINWNKLIADSYVAPPAQGWHTNTFVGVTGMAQGGEGMVTKPTLFLAGEAGPEEYKFSPVGKGTTSGGPTIQVTLDLRGAYVTDGLEIQKLAERGAQKALQKYNEGR